MASKLTVNRKLLISYYIFLGVGIVLLILHSKTELFKLLTFNGGQIVDFFFKGITSLGNGLFAFIFALLAGFKKIRYALYLFITYSFSGILTQLLKRLVFPDALRPMKYFSELGETLTAISGYENHFFYSFPSGHTATAFAVYFGLAFVVRNGYLKYALLFLSILVGYSRIYLLEHFPEDVLAGSLVGVLTVILFYPIVFSWKKSWLDYSYMHLIKIKNE